MGPDAVHRGVAGRVGALAGIGRFLGTFLTLFAALVVVAHTAPVPQVNARSGDTGPSLTGALTIGRYRHTATLLPDGRVLLAGGAYDWLPGETYSPATRAFVPTSPMTSPRDFHTATLLLDGRVLVAGGRDGDVFVESTGGTTDNVLDTAELFDPASDTFSATGELVSARMAHAATLLPDGRVLLTGGWGAGSEPIDSVEVYDPATGSFASLGPMSTARVRHVAAVLPDGSVLLAGGQGTSHMSLASAEVYVSTAGTSRPADRMRHARSQPTSTKLPDGRIMVAGGFGPRGIRDDVELFDPSTGRFSDFGVMHTARYGHSATLLAEGSILLAGNGEDFGSRTAEVYDLAAEASVPTDRMATTRVGHTATLLPDGQALIAGGGWDSAELFDPPRLTFSLILPTAPATPEG